MRKGAIRMFRPESAKRVYNVYIDLRVIIIIVHKSFFI